MKDFKHLIKKHINKIFIAVLAAAFITTAALTAVLGVNIYSIASSGDMPSSPDSAVSYITEKVRECEDKSNLRTATLGGSIPALVISSDTEENSRDTWIYVYDGYLREINPTGTKVEFSGDNRASYDFSDNLRKFQWGAQIGTEWKAFKHLIVYADLTWGLNDIFQKDFDTITFGMYPIYLNVGFGYAF